MRESTSLTAGRTKKAINSVFASFVELFVILISGFILPRMIIIHYGSAINGLIASVARFISLVSILNAGISGAARAILYEPLARHDTRSIASVVCSLEAIYRKIGIALLAFVALLSIAYPLWICKDYDYTFTALLVLIVAMANFAQYVMGYPYKILLFADQKHSIVSLMNALFTLLASTGMAMLILCGQSILWVRFTNSLLIAFGALSLAVMARKRYGLSSAVMKEAGNSVMKYIPGRKYALAQGFSDYINANIDIILITLVMSVTDVAVYAVYAAVTTCCIKLITSIISSFGAAFGNMYVNGEDENMRDNFKIYECIVFSFCSTVLATMTAVIVPFVRLYTTGVTDADYNQPVFAFILSLSTLFMCSRIPYEAVLKAAGYFRQTKNGAYVEAGLNLLVSVVGIFLWGLPGVALGTLVSAAVRAFELAWCFCRKLIKRSYSVFFIHIFETGIIFIIAIFIAKLLSANISSWFDWVIASFVIFMGCSGLTALVVAIRYRDVAQNLWMKILAVIKK